MRKLISIFVLLIAPTIVHSQSLDCRTVVECAQLSVQAASEAKAAVAELNSSFQQEIAKLRQENAQLRQKLTTTENKLRSVPGRSHTGYTPSRGGGSSAMTMAAQCPSGQVMVGIEVIVGGTCRNQCNADGGTLHKYRVVCSPRFN